MYTYYTLTCVCTYLLTDLSFGLNFMHAHWRSYRQPYKTIYEIYDHLPRDDCIRGSDHNPNLFRIIFAH